MTKGDKVLGIIFPNMHDNAIGELTKLRTMASVTFGGRYRLVDFTLSEMVAAGIDVVLGDDGSFRKVANMHYQVGQTVTDIVEMQVPKVREETKKKSK